MSSFMLFSVILYVNLSCFRVNNLWSFVYYLCHCKCFFPAKLATFFDDNKIPSGAVIIFIMGKINFSFIEVLKFRRKQYNKLKLNVELV